MIFASSGQGVVRVGFNSGQIVITSRVLKWADFIAKVGLQKNSGSAAQQTSASTGAGHP